MFSMDSRYGNLCELDSTKPMASFRHQSTGFIESFDAEVPGLDSSKSAACTTGQSICSTEISDGDVPDLESLMEEGDSHVAHLSGIIADVEDYVSAHSHVKLIENTETRDCFYALSQGIAIVRHAERLDRTCDWEGFSARARWPNDTPLSQEGHDHAAQVGHQLKASGKPYGLVVASPYLRCAQTAGRIAQILNLPVQLDLDLGEVFDRMCFVGKVEGPQHRSACDLEAQLEKEFPGVVWKRDKNNAVQIEGKQQVFPERLDAARQRFCFKTQHWAQRAAGKLESVILVTHGDAVGAVLGMMRPDLKVQSVPCASFAVASRQVNVLQKGSSVMKSDEPLYETPSDWTFKLSDGLEVEEVHRCSLKRAFAMQAHSLRKMNSQQHLIDLIKEVP